MFEMVEPERKWRKLIGLRSGAWCAGVGFGRARMGPSPEERAVWERHGCAGQFEAGLRYGRSLDPKLEQVCLELTREP